MADLIVVDELYDWLVELGLAQPNRGPRPSPTVPSLWLMPRGGGIPEPRSGEGMTITLVDTGLGSPSSMEPWLEEVFVEVTTRSRSENAARLVHRALRGLLAPEDQPGGRRNFAIGAINPVEFSLLWKPEQPLRSPDRQTYVRQAGFCIRVRCAVLRGETYP